MRLSEAGYQTRPLICSGRETIETVLKTHKTHKTADSGVPVGNDAR